ncbi:MAG: NUDIX domain-containing protein [Candidatus Pacebacteria bacterium]|nr:NUDIX domain-containing protein [Candidatus Paceibacterota bacterium]
MLKITKKFSGKYLDVFLETDKNEKVREKVYLKDSINIFIVDKKENLYLLKEKRWEKNNKKVVKLVSGLVENGEKTIEAAKRELKEEVGNLDIKRWKKVFTYNQKGTINQKRYYYLVFIGAKPKHSKTFLCEYTKEKLNKLILNGYFGFTTSGVLIKYMIKLNNE